MKPGCYLAAVLKGKLEFHAKGLHLQVTQLES